MGRRAAAFAAVTIAVADFNGNSDPDLAVVNLDSDSVTAMLEVGQP
jgi:hypothetical protein